MNITMNRGGVIGALVLAAYTTLWVFLSLRGLNDVRRLLEIGPTGFVTGFVVGAFVGNRLWSMVLDARASTSGEQGDG